MFITVQWSFTKGGRVATFLSVVFSVLKVPPFVDVEPSDDPVPWWSYQHIASCPMQHAYELKYSHSGVPDFESKDASL